MTSAGPFSIRIRIFGDAGCISIDRTVMYADEDAARREFQAMSMAPLRIARQILVELSQGGDVIATGSIWDDADLRVITINPRTGRMCIDAKSNEAYAREEVEFYTRYG